jgi:hypothetical protein
MRAGAFYAHGSGLIGRNARYVAGRADDSSHRVLNRAFPIPSASYCRRDWTRRGKIGRRNPSLSCIRRRNADRLGPSGLSLVARTPSLLIIDRILRLTCRRPAQPRSRLIARVEGDGPALETRSKRFAGRNPGDWWNAIASGRQRRSASLPPSSHRATDTEAPMLWMRPQPISPRLWRLSIDRAGVPTRGSCAARPHRSSHSACRRSTSKESARASRLAASPLSGRPLKWSGAAPLKWE